MLPLFCQDANGSISELLPTFALVRAGLMSADRQCGVEQEYALIGPTGQVSVVWYGCAQVAFNLLEDVL